MSASPACLRCSGTGRLQSSVTLDSEIRCPFFPAGPCFHSFTSHTYNSIMNLHLNYNRFFTASSIYGSERDKIIKTIGRLSINDQSMSSLVATTTY
jgi:hypothetical protein